MKVIRTLVLFVDDLLLLAGAAVLCHGISQIYIPAAWIVGGLVLMGYGVMFGLQGKTK